MNEENHPLSKEEQLESILHDLENIRDMLIEVNEQLGCFERYRAIKEEIEQVGWSSILNQYHPDINVDDSAAIELFTLYKYVYETMNQ